MSSFAIKMIAAASMLIDHVGLIFFPTLSILRIIGRLAFPIFAFCIAEGFRHTRDKRRYFLQVFLLGALCQIVYFIVDGSVYLGVLISFSAAIVLMWACEGMMTAPAGKRLGAALLFAAALALAFILCRSVEVDYGFWGMMLPLLLFIGGKKPWNLLLFALGLTALCWELAVQGGFTVQWFSLLTLPILWLYNGERGRYRAKYFFYIFYPAHLAALYLLDMLI